MKQDKDWQKLKRKAGVHMVGWGFRTVGGLITAEQCWVVTVTEKLPLSQLANSDIVPRFYKGEKTDVVEGDMAVALEVDRTAMHRPAPGGVSIGHRDITAGTLGCRVKKKGVPKILSNNHVLGNINKAVKGDPIYQPGPYHGGTIDKHIFGWFDEFIRIETKSASECRFSNFVVGAFNFLAELLGRQTRLSATVEPELNLTDSAIADYDKVEYITPEILGIGELAPGIVDPELGMAVKKSGAMSGVTHGFVSKIHVTCEVRMGAYLIAEFAEQFMISPSISIPGDSGSLVVTEQNIKVGLLFAGSPEGTVANECRYVWRLHELD